MHHTTSFDIVGRITTGDGWEEMGNRNFLLHSWSDFELTVRYFCRTEDLQYSERCPRIEEDNAQWIILSMMFAETVSIGFSLLSILWSLGHNAKQTAKSWGDTKKLLVTTKSVDYRWRKRTPSHQNRKMWFLTISCNSKQVSSPPPKQSEFTADLEQLMCNLNLSSAPDLVIRFVVLTTTWCPDHVGLRCSPCVCVCVCVCVFASERVGKLFSRVVSGLKPI